MDVPLTADEYDECFEVDPIFSVPDDKLKTYWYTYFNVEAHFTEMIKTRDPNCDINQAFLTKKYLDSHFKQKGIQQYSSLVNEIMKDAPGGSDKGIKLTDLIIYSNR
jgi:hypothetical protein